ncbi:membrane protein YczE [Leucobacter celer]|uniref:membrane protein YczE n=1 Tax=Leucobacter celer TaxID=668625 RepID=UPI0006A76C7E|nr:membrane protein [Leucobacter celer]
MLPRLARLIPGLLLYGIADAFMIRAVIGVDPWTVFAQGLSVHSGLGIGLLTNIIGLLVLLLWIPLRQKPGIGTILNILLVGPGIELGLWLLPAPEPLWLRVLFFAIGLVLLAVASGIYIGARLGPGPRDGLMTGIHARFGTPIWVGRTAVEVTVLAIGWVLGGNVGLGTVAFALLIGPLCSVTLPLFDPSRRTGRRAAAGDRNSERPAAPAAEESLPA